ncbi:PAS/PAC sensor signal transduction histidine kinase [Methanohalophilus mahii DSM 5219]|uniref:histidine kinase n=2 Tax=Methanohalophilus mahii TaxID=2176 RepID=D5EC53_METMS|nr:PAS/PAC sensor signal transduction histidine kinase [Methanohalophilus mahii DSM 5219]
MVLMGTGVHNSLFDNMFYEILAKDISFDQKMEELTKVLPQILRYPEKASARIILGPYSYMSPDFKQGKHQISSSSISKNEEEGHELCIELFYNNLSLKNNYSPFNSDEKQKLDFIAKILSIFIDKEIELKRARYDYDFLLGSTNEIPYSLNSEGNIVYISPKVQEYGLHPDQMIFRPFTDYIYADDMEEWLNIFNNITSVDHLPLKAQIRIQNDNQELHWFQNHIDPIYDEMGNFMGINGIVREINRRKEAELHSQEQSEAFRFLARACNQFVDPFFEDIDLLIEPILEKIMGILDADSIFIYELNHSGSNMHLTHYTSASHVKERCELAMDKLNSLSTAQFPTLIEKFQKNEIYSVNSIGDIPDSEKYLKGLLTTLDFESAQIMPVHVENQLVGFIGVVSATKNKHWPPYSDDLLRILFDSIFNAKERGKTYMMLDNTMHLYRSLFDRSNDAIFIHSSEGAIIDANRSACKIIGCSHSDMLSMKIADLYPQESRYVAQLKSAVQSTFNEGSTRFESKMKHMNNSIIDVEISSSMLDKENNIMLSIVRDITERKKYELELESYRKNLEELVDQRTSELQTANSWVSALYDNAPIGIGVLNKDLELIDLNKGMTELTGIPREKIVGKSLFSIFTEGSSNYIDKDLGVSILEKQFSTELHWLCNKKHICIQFNSQPLGLKDSPKKVIFTAQDITRRKQAEIALKDYAGQLEKSNEMKDLFTDIMRHDLLNPANIVKGFTDILIKNEKEEKKIHFLSRIRDNTERLIDMIENTAYLSKLESTETLELQKMDLGRVLTSCISEMTPLAENENMGITYDLQQPYPVQANPVIKEVFINLLSNAIKYSPPESSIHVGVQEKDDSFKVMIKDKGFGIADDDKPYIFNRFSRAQKGSIKGTGLGLAIVKRIVELHGGSVGVEDNPGGKGSVFWVYVKKYSE